MWSQHIPSYCHGICLAQLRKIMKNSEQSVTCLRFDTDTSWIEVYSVRPSLICLSQSSVSQWYDVQYQFTPYFTKTIFLEDIFLKLQSCFFLYNTQFNFNFPGFMLLLCKWSTFLLNCWLPWWVTCKHASII